ncbi:MAG: hypothetical protein J6S67_11375 [Methanobrevibacter sp.]|nr:hypothetical protein [Methanobrevibacter sp.]
MINSPNCLWAGQVCNHPHDCNNCAVRERESKTYPEHVINMLSSENAYDDEWKSALKYACKCIKFTSIVCKIIEANEFPEYAQDEIISAIIGFRNSKEGE